MSKFTVSYECEKNYVSVGQDCEHCETLDFPEYIYCDGLTRWCLDCASYGDVNEKEVIEIRAMLKDDLVLSLEKRKAQIDKIILGLS